MLGSPTTLVPLLASAAAGMAAAQPLGERDIYATAAKFATAIAIGLLVGLEREWAKSTDKMLFAGIRTFPFITLLGCLSAMIATEQGIAWFFGAAFVGFTAFVAANHVVTGGAMGHGLGTTTEITSLLMFLLGGLVFWGHPGLAAALTVVVTVILSIKQPLHALAQRVESQDIYATLKFAVISVIVLPLLPDTRPSIEGFPYLEVLNPRRIWLLVILVTGIAFLGYISAKIVGPGRGIALTGLLGGVVSSTAVALSMAERSREQERLAPQLSLAVVLASTVLFIRTVVEVAIVNRPLAHDLVTPLIGASGFGVAASAYLWFRGARAPTDAVEMKNPFSLVPALKFGAVFAAMLVAAKYMALRFDRTGVFVAAAVGGLVDARPIALSVANLALEPGALSRHDAVAAVMLGTLANTVLKFALAALNGAPAFRRTLIPAFTLVIVGGVAATAFVIKYGQIWLH